MNAAAVASEVQLPSDGEGGEDTGLVRDGEPVMRIKVQSPQKVFFDEFATSISGANATGPFDILPRHHNFITLIDPCELVIRRPGKQAEQRIKIAGGLMHVKADKVIVFLDV